MTVTPSPDISLQQVSFGYNSATMLFEGTIPGGKITTIIGPSGSGKSTLLNLIAGFERPKSGRIFIGDHEVTELPPAARPVSMIFQENNLFAHLTVKQNVGLGCSPNLKLTSEDHQSIASALERVGLSGKEKRKPEALSGGERQRVAIARVLVRDQPILLLDEAFASLGPALRREMLELVRELQQKTGMTVLIVTHTPEDALYLDTHLLFIENGQISIAGEASQLLTSSGPAALQSYVGFSQGNLKRD